MSIKQENTDRSTFDLAKHDLAVSFDSASPSEYGVVGVCACSSPDGNGEGRMDWAGETLTDVVGQYTEHILEEMVR